MATRNGRPLKTNLYSDDLEVGVGDPGIDPQAFFQGKYKPIVDALKAARKKGAGHQTEEPTKSASKPV